jgi:hypothetical protein
MYKDIIILALKGMRNNNMISQTDFKEIIDFIDFKIKKYDNKNIKNKLPDPEFKKQHKKIIDDLEIINEVKK